MSPVTPAPKSARTRGRDQPARTSRAGSAGTLGRDRRAGASSSGTRRGAGSRRPRRRTQQERDADEDQDGEHGPGRVATVRPPAPERSSGSSVAEVWPARSTPRRVRARRATGALLGAARGSSICWQTTLVVPSRVERDAVHHARDLHRPLLVRHDQHLRVAREPVDRAGGTGAGSRRRAPARPRPSGRTGWAAP